MNDQKPMNLKYRKFSSKRKFGVELETNQHLSQETLVKIVRSASESVVAQTAFYTQDFNNDYWHVKFDRSCGDYANQGGWEIASPVLFGYKGLGIISSVSKAIKEAGAKTNKNCAFHIHCNVEDFSLNQLASLTAHWFKIEKIIYEMVPHHRRSSKYCIPLWKRYNFNKPTDKLDINYFWEVVKPRVYLNHSKQWKKERRVSFNLYNLNTVKRTVEFRLPEGTFNSFVICNWIRLFLSFVENVKTIPYPNSLAPVNLFECLKILGLHNTDPFYILSSGLFHTKLWFFKRILKYSDDTRLKEVANAYIMQLT
jgi:hypothetical protein